MDNEYKISLGVKLDTSDIISEINKAESKVDPIKIKVDAETKELTKNIQDALKTLSKGSKNALTLDTTALENSLRDVKDAVVEIRNLFGTIDDRSGMKSLLSSVNQIATTIGKVTDETDTLVKSLNALSKKDFNINLGIDMNKKGLNTIGYGRAARKQVIPELESQIKYLEDLFGGQQATMNRLASQGGKIGFDVFTDFGDFNSDTAIRKMEAMEKYINSLKKLAAIDNVNLDGFNERFSRGATELINDITGIENAVDKAGDVPQKLKNLFGSGVDGEGLSKQLDSIVTDLNEIKTAIQGLSSGVSLEGLTQSFDRLSDSIEQLVKNCTTVKQAINDSVDNVGKSVGQGGSETGIKETSNELKKLKDLAHQIGQLDFKIVKSDYNDEINQVKEFERQLELLKTQYNETLNSLNGKDLDIGSEITKEFTEARNKIAEFEAKVSDTKRKLAEDIKTNIGTNITKDINKVHSDFNRLSTQSEELRQKLELLDSIKIDLDTAAANNDIEGLITANERYEKVLKDVKAQLDINRRTERDANDVESLTLGKENAMLRLKSLFGDNSEAAKKFGSELNRIQKELDECGDAKGLQRINKEITNLGRKVKEANVQTQTFGDKLKKQFSQYSSYLSIASLYMYVEQGLRSMFEQVKLIDSAMTELKKVTNETDAAYNKFLTNAATRSREIGTTIDGLVSSTADFARLGYGFEDAQGLAEVANIYAVVGDEINGVEGATESLISTMAAFKDEMNGMSNTDFAMSIIDKFNEIGNNFAISSGGIGEALERSASSLMAANNTIDESIALITAANTVVQDPAQVGTAFKTISMRIRGAKTELEEAGLETEGMVESTAKLRQEILTLSGVDIMKNANEFKSTYQIMDELAVKWKDLTDIQQASITELIAGKRQGNIVSSLMTNFDTARDALETSLNSAGSAMAEHEKWQQSLEAQINKLKASWQGLSQAFLKSDFLHGALDAIIGLVDGVTKLIDTFGTLPTLLTGFTIFKSFGNKGLFKTFNNDLDGFVNKIGFANKSFAELTNAFKSANTGGFKGFINGLKSMGDALAHPLSQSDLSAIESYNKLIDDGVDGQVAFAQTMKGTSNAAQSLVQSANGSKVALTGMKTATIGSKVALIGAKAAAIAFNAALTMGISLLIDFAVSGIMKLVNAKKDLAESVDELTSKFKEQHNELIKLKGNYDTTNESSMISRYDKLSKGVDGLGRNVSLTAEEYSEYQSIVNSIADQIPSLVSGYDEQGNALLSCKGNVEELTDAYQKLIHAQNQEILTNTKDIEKDFANTIKDNNKQNWYLDWFGRGSVMAHFMDYNMTTDAAKTLKDLLNSDVNERSKKIKNLDYQTKREIETALENVGIDTGFGGINLEKALEETLKTDPAKIKGIVDDFYGTFTDAIEEQKTIATAKLSEAFDISGAISGLDYSNISEELQTIAYQTVNSLDYDFFENLSKSGKTVEQWTTEMLNQLNAISKVDNKQIETGFELQTKFNGGDISYGEYVANLRDVEKTIDGLNLKDEVKEQLKISLNLDENGVVDQYDALLKRLTSKEIGLNDKTAKSLLNNLSAEELSVLVDVIPQLDAGTTVDEIQSLIDEQLATEFKFDIVIQSEGIEAFNTALTESRSAAGLTSESISALKARYEDLDGFNAAALFEKTANGIHLNSEELSRLEEQYISTNKLDIENNLNKLVTKYNDLTEEIKGCTDAQEKENLQLQADKYKDKIEELSTLASQYDGLTSAFAKWQTALEGAEEGDNYDSLYENLEGIKELYDKGLVGTDKFKTAVQLMTNKDLANADIDEIVSAYKKGYPKMQRYFTEGQKGCKNFLNDVRKLNSEWAHMNKDGSWEINFNAEEVAKELGVSVDFVLQIAKKLKDYGFEVNLEDSSVDNLKTKIEQTEAKLKELGQSPVDINVDIEANSKNLGTIESEIEKAKSKIKEINNSSVEPKVKTAQLEDAQAKLETLIDKKIEASQPAFMNLDTSQVSASLVVALEKVQSYQDAINEVNKLSELKEAGITIDDSQLQTAKEKVDECAKAIQGLDGNVKLSIGLEEDGSIDSIKKAFEEGKVKIDTNTDPALTKIEQLAENVDRIEDKDVTINVRVKGLNKVKELNKQIDLATKIDGNIDKLTDYVESAKTLSGLNDNITSYVTANVKGNVTEIPEYKINNLKVFADSVQDLEDVGSFTSNVKADVKGNVIETPEHKLNNLKVFTDSAKNLDDIGSIKSEVTAEIKGNVIDEFEYKINNLKVFSDSAKDLDKIGDIEAKVTANVEGNVIDKFEYKLNNLKVFTDNAKGLENVGDVEANVKANVKGNVTDEFEYKLNNLKVFTDNAKDVEKIGNVKSEVSANIEGNVVDTFEYKIDNLKTFTDNAKDIEKIGNVKSKVVADVEGNVIDEFEYKLNNLKVFSDNAADIEKIGSVTSKVKADVEGNVVDEFEYKLNNLKVFSDSAKDIADVGVIESKVTANVEGNVTDEFEYKLNNLKVFTDSAKDIKNLGTIESKVAANVEGNVVDEFEYKINNLKVFADGVKDLKNIGNVTSEVSADVSGNVIDTRESKINNLKVFTNSVKDIKDIGTVTSKVTADVSGNVIDTREGKIDNLKVYTDSAKKVESIGTVNSSVTANVYGNVIDTREGKIDNLKVFGESAKKTKDIGTVNSNVTANVNGNVINTTEKKIDNLGVFATNANKLKNTGNFTSSVSANVSGNVITDDTVNSDLEHFASIVSGMSNQTVAVNVTANVDSANINAAIDLLQKVANSGTFKDYKATVQVGAKIATIDDTTVKNYKAPKKDGKVAYSVDPKSSVFTWTAPSKKGVVNYAASVEALTKAQKHKTGTITYKAKVTGFPVVNGTANANGTAFANGTSGKAYRQGDWGAKRTETALTGELGRELVVYKNRYWTVGDNGAEFTTIPKGAIVFNHKQTEELFKNGRVTSDGGRGRAFVEGTAYENITGGGKFYNSSTGESYGSTSKSDSSTDDEFEEVLDWIEVILERVERSIDKFDQQANNIYKSWSSRNTALQNQISEVNKEIGLQQQAKNKYMSAANGVGLSSSWAAKVRNGEIDIDTIKDEALADKIKSYQEYYEKALDCEDAIRELREEESKLYAQRFENVQSQYDGILQGYEHTEAMLNEYISQAEAQGHIVSTKYYDALIANEKQSIAELKKEQAALIAERDKAVADGKITKGSEAWLEQCAAIDEVTQSIEEANTALIEYNNAIRDIEWETFDMLQEKISDVTAESEFLIDLMSNKDLYDDNGKFTDQGVATVGLHALNYNTAMYQADDYGAQIAEIDRKIASGELDGNSKEVINRRRELVELQRESILAAESEKDAIRDLVEEGINLELDALQERIDLHNKELDSMKDLYDYQKRVKEQTEEIASLEKQMAAYSNDDSEEAKAKIQELKVSLEDAKADLEETEYDKFISDSAALLDELYLEYETVLNSRLDNIDALLEQVIAEINVAAGAEGTIATALGSEGAIATILGNNTTTIKDTLVSETSKVGTTLSTAMNDIWSVGDGNAKSVLTMYGQGFQDKQTTTNAVLGSIKSDVAAMVDDVDKDAQKKVTANKTTTSAKKDPTKTTATTAAPKPKPKPTNTTSTGDGKPAVGDKVKFVSGKYYYDSQGQNPAGSKNQGKEVYITSINTKSWATHPYHISTGKKLGSGDLGWLKLSQISGYATGKKNFLEDEIAWTQEKGREYIIRPSDGAILTPLAKGDSVLNANASNNIWDMANSPAEFIKDNLNLGNAKVPNNSNVQNAYTQHLDKVVFNLPNVKNYEQLLSEMQKDRNFEKLILSMTIDRLAGKSSLAKGKSIR